MNDELKFPEDEELVIDGGDPGKEDDDTEELKALARKTNEAGQAPFTSHPPALVVKGSGAIVDPAKEPPKTESEVIGEVLDMAEEEVASEEKLPASATAEIEEGGNYPEPGGVIEAATVAVTSTEIVEATVPLTPPVDEDPPSNRQIEDEVSMLKAKLIRAEQRAEQAVQETKRIREQYQTLGDGALSRRDEIDVLVSAEAKRLNRCPTPDEMEEITQAVDVARKARRVARKTKDSEFTPNKPPKRHVSDQQARGRDSEFTPNKPPRPKKEKGWV